MEIPRENLAKSGKPFFRVVFAPEGSAFTSRAKRGLVKKTPRVKRPPQKKVCLMKQNFPVGFSFSMMECTFFHLNPVFVAFEGFNLLTFGLDATAEGPKAVRRTGGPGGGAPWEDQRTPHFSIKIPFQPLLTFNSLF